MRLEAAKMEIERRELERKIMKARIEEGETQNIESKIPDTRRLTTHNPPPACKDTNAAKYASPHPK